MVDHTEIISHTLHESQLLRLLSRSSAALLFTAITFYRLLVVRDSSVERRTTPSPRRTPTSATPSEDGDDDDDADDEECQRLVYLDADSLNRDQLLEHVNHLAVELLAQRRYVKELRAQLYRQVSV